MSVQSEVDWKGTVQRIRDGDRTGEEVLYRHLVSGARLLLLLRLQTDEVDDRVHDLFVIVVGAIRRGEIREPEHLMAFVRTVLNRQMSMEIGRIVRRRRNSLDLELAADLKTTDASPEEEAAEHQKVEPRFWYHEPTAEARTDAKSYEPRGVRWFPAKVYVAPSDPGKEAANPHVIRTVSRRFVYLDLGHWQQEGTSRARDFGVLWGPHAYLCRYQPGPLGSTWAAKVPTGLCRGKNSGCSRSVSDSMK